MVALGITAVGEAQGFRVRGDVTRRTGSDSTVLSDAWTYLHEVTPGGGEIVDSQLTSIGGLFSLRSPRFDTIASYIVSVDHHGIQYFSEPFRADGVGTPRITVFDTSSVKPVIGLGERHIILQPLEPDGTRRVVELFVLRNAGVFTRVSSDTSAPVFEVTLPSNILSFEIGAADVSEQAVYLRDERLAVAAPIPPGERQILVSYVLPRNRRRLDIPIDQPTGHLNVLIADSGATVEPALLEFRGWETLEGTSYRRFALDGAEKGLSVALALADVPLSRDVALLVLIPIVATVMVLAFVHWMRKTAQPAVHVATDDPRLLAVQIAALDKEAPGRDSNDYQLRRAELKARLVEALAKRGDTE